MPERLAAVIAIAHAAGEIIRAGFGAVRQIEYKGAVNPVTEIDTAAEALIKTRLQQTFPEHRILAEETGGADLHTPGPLWVVDPLDGTNNFAHSFPHFCVSLGLLVDGEPTLGVIYDPLRDETFAAGRGAGATLNGRPLRVSAVPRLAAALLATGFPYARRTLADNNTRMLDHFLRRSEGVRRAGAAALDLAYVAAGRLDGYWEGYLSPWDIAAGILLVQEAGGVISDFSGGNARIFDGGEMVASNGYIHAEMLRVLRDGAAAPHPDYPPLS